MSRSGADRCPDVERLFKASDGLLGRVSVPGSLLSFQALLEFTAAMDSLGCLVELTSRANLQVRQLTDGTVEPFRLAVSQLADQVPGAGSAPQVCTYAWPVQGVPAADLATLGEQLSVALSSAMRPDRDGLSGGQCSLQPSRKLQIVVLAVSINSPFVSPWSCEADLALEVSPSSLSITVPTARRRWQMARTPGTAAAVVDILAQATSRFEHYRSMMPPAAFYRQAVKSAPAARPGSEFAIGRQNNAATYEAAQVWHPRDLPPEELACWLEDVDVACQRIGMTPKPTKAAPSATRLGTFEGSLDGIPMVGVNAEDTQLHIRPRSHFLSAKDLSQLHTVLAEAGRWPGDQSPVALLPWGGLLVPLAPLPIEPGKVEPGTSRAAWLDALTQWHVDPRDPVSRISTCVGRPACSRALADVQDVAQQVSRETHRAGLPVRISGCARSCGKPVVPHLGIVAHDDGWSAQIVRSSSGIDRAHITSDQMDQDSQEAHHSQVAQGDQKAQCDQMQHSDRKEPYDYERPGWAASPLAAVKQCLDLCQENSRHHGLESN